MIIVSGHLQVDPARRNEYLETCREVVVQARSTAGCLDFAISADLVSPGRINIVERWDAQSTVDTFRGSGVGDDQGAMIISAQISEFDVRTERRLAP